VSVVFYVAEQGRGFRQTGIWELPLRWFLFRRPQYISLHNTRGQITNKRGTLAWKAVSQAMGHVVLTIYALLCSE
jgi:hypothetical protein